MTHHKDQRWVSNECDGGGEFALVASAVRPRQLVSILGQSQLAQRPLNHLKQVMHIDIQPFETGAAY